MILYVWPFRLRGVVQLLVRLSLVSMGFGGLGRRLAVLKSLGGGVGFGRGCFGGLVRLVGVGLIVFKAIG